MLAVAELKRSKVRLKMDNEELESRQRNDEHAIDKLEVDKDQLLEDNTFLQEQLEQLQQLSDRLQSRVQGTTISLTEWMHPTLKRSR